MAKPPPMEIVVFLLASSIDQFGLTTCRCGRRSCQMAGLGQPEPVSRYAAADRSTPDTRRSVRTLAAALECKPELVGPGAAGDRCAPATASQRERPLCRVSVAIGPRLLPPPQ
ncbi:hypothetical protein amb0913 [Paramagnetospirillum magneticum AMB-1]|uniref:Uncharacterized protein n=1 Tax=Paramagnetospirillum magneticum (strain ATCC 700264 / AMB-1) TaxID=342108 RepID=Q2W8V8_PARM1|nr:hypothetical protein amb0913 [Paramagnetospirillum magneticum AMB-1]